MEEWVGDAVDGSCELRVCNATSRPDDPDEVFGRRAQGVVRQQGRDCEVRIRVRKGSQLLARSPFVFARTLTHFLLFMVLD